MTRPLFALFILTLMAPVLEAQEWATKMFGDRHHDFGAVARYAETTFRFELENKYVEDVHIAGVRASCGCTTPTIEKATLKTWEKGAILAKFNTDRFMGRKQATVTVTIDKPFFAEVQLTVTGYIRPDVVFHPGRVDFGTVSQAEGGTKKVSVSYAGRSNWAITDVRNTSEEDKEKYEVELGEPQRLSNKVTYDMTIHIKPGAPAGFFKDSLTIVTNDGRNQRMSLPVYGKVASALSIAPAALSLGEVKMGESMTKRVIVQAKQPFVVVEVNTGEGNGLSATMDGLSVPKNVHVIPIVYSPTKPGSLQQQVVVSTSIGASNFMVTSSVK